MHNRDCIAQQLGRIDILCLCCGQRNLHLQLYTPDYREAGVHDVVAGPGLGGDCIFAGSRAIPVATKFGVGIHLEALVTFGVQRDSLSINDLKVLDQMDYCVSVLSPWILGEAGATMRCKSDAMLSANIQEVEISHDCPVVEPLTEQRGCSVAS